jgi:glycerol-3-phosphate cytidylyltransferase
MKVVFSAAILDLCHAGHLNLLRKMRVRGEKVIMVLHDDYSCYLIKDKFPVWDLKRRKRALKMTGLVDKIITTYETDPADEFEKIIKKHPKDEMIFMRGDDNENFPGRWLIDDYAIPIEFIPYTKGVSSTKLRKELQQDFIKKLEK